MFLPNKGIHRNAGFGRDAGFSREVNVRTFRRNSRKKVEMLNTEQVLGLSIRVFNECGGTVTKAPQWGVEVAEEDKGKSNKEKVLALLDAEIQPTADEVQTAKEMAARLHGKLVMNELKGAKHNEFMSNIADFTKDEEIPKFGVGTVVWLPKVANDIQKQEDEQEKMQSIGVDSQFIGRVKDKVELTVVPIKTRFVDHIGKHSITATVNGDLVSFWFKDSLPVNKPITVRGRIKDHQVDKWLFNNKVTRLNFVKEVG